MRWMTVWMAGCTVGVEVPLTCEEVDQEVQQTLRDVAAANRTCNVAEDCEVVWVSATCSQSCSDIVGIDGVAAFEAARDEAEAGICAENPSCEPYALPCAPPGALDCVSGSCVEIQ